jgi:hypothetical protein
MNVHVRALRGARHILEALQADGWQVRAGGEGALVAAHPQVADERAARLRLAHLGLLTASSLHIEFRCFEEPDEPRPLVRQ